MKKIISLLAILLLLACLPGVVHAHEIPDLNRTGSLTFTLSWEGAPLNTGSLHLYRVADITENDGNYSFSLVEELAAADVSLEALGSAALAAELEALAKEKNLPRLTGDIREGTAQFANLTLGLYVVSQDQASACEGFAPISPFLISLPRNDNGSYVYDVTAAPKVPLETVPTEPSEPTAPTEPPEPSLPQTGQLNWPVPVLAASGMLLFLLGWFLRFGKKESYEK